MKTHPFPGKARLKSRTAVEALFARNSSHDGSCLCYPLRAVWNSRQPHNTDTQLAKLMISVPKKKLRHAVDRVTARRRIREAWRLARAFDTTGNNDVAIIYVADELKNYRRIAAAVDKIIARLQNGSHPAAHTTQP